MPSGEIGALSLAVIAVAVLVAVIFLVPALIEVRRAAARAARTIEHVDAVLPTLLSEMSEAVGTINRTAETVASFSASVERLDRLSAAAARMMVGALSVLGAMGTTTRGVVVPSLANLAGVLSAVREGMEWLRPRRDKGRNGA